MDDQLCYNLLVYIKLKFILIKQGIQSSWILYNQLNEKRIIYRYIFLNINK